jgi:DNA mismatch repair protein MutS
MSDTTPMMQQYSRLKRTHSDAVLFFRLGDFYEMFRKDAVEVSRLLGLTLTQRNGVPMCGIPYHASRGYIARLIRAGKKVAVCEQIKLPESGKGLAERDVVEIITPGTVTDEEYLDDGTNNYLVALGKTGNWLSLSWVDLSTGELTVAQFAEDDLAAVVRRELARLAPREVLIQESVLNDVPGISDALETVPGLVRNSYPDWNFDIPAGEESLKHLLGVVNLKGFGLEESQPALYTIGVLIEYLRDTSRSVLSHIRSVTVYDQGRYVRVDETTQKNLELIKNLQDGGTRYTLLSVLDHTGTAMGARLLRRWILYPLRSIEEIRKRHRAVSVLYHNQMLLSELRSILKSIRDIERLAARVGLERAHAKDLVALRDSLYMSLRLFELLAGWPDGPSVLQSDADRKTIRFITDLLDRGITDEPSLSPADGSVIRDGYDTELDDLRALRDDSTSILDRYLEQEKQETGITGLRIRSNRILGYYFEIGKSREKHLPERFIRRQSLSNVERFTTERLSELESAINSASGKIVEREKEIFIGIRTQIKDRLGSVMKAASDIGTLDVLQSFAWAATLHGYTEPILADNTVIKIRMGRHPVVEAQLEPGGFVPNSLDLLEKKRRFALITGPNMAGKSTVLRQTALIALMAQIGAFVPAEQAEIGIVDRIFCRVGASDNLARGESTFLVEMNETAGILRNATSSSLVIMDEVGRGTGTRDGLAIAWAVSEYILEKIKPRALFATHFHELTQLEHPLLYNLSMSVQDSNGSIVFLKKIVEEPSENSYGIHVAELAGVPQQVIARATHLLSSFSNTGFAGTESGKGIPEKKASPVEQISRSGQTDLFSPGELITSEILSLELDETTPLQALNLVGRWKSILQDTLPET